jgi:threonyl-tRNA synthetase
MLPSQIESEIKNVLNLVDEMYKVFGLEYHLELSTMPENHIGDISDWEVAENGLKNALINIGREFVINEGDGAFYGPKIDIHIKDAIGRTWQCGTIQLDMQLPKRFNLEYIDEDGQRKEPVMIHRVVYGSIDRFLGIITENYAGAFPTWLSPVQAQILPISEKFIDNCNQVKEALKAANVRVEIDERNEKIGYKIRSAISQKIPYIIIIGENEIANNTVSVRKRGTNETVEYKVEDFVNLIKAEIQERR